MASRTKSRTKEQLHQLVDELDNVRAAALLTLLGGERRSEPQVAEKGPTSPEDPLWNIVGMVGEEYESPTDVSANKYRYIAEHPEIKID
jgi:hypothetical protein